MAHLCPYPHLQINIDISGNRSYCRAPGYSCCNGTSSRSNCISSFWLTEIIFCPIRTWELPNWLRKTKLKYEKGIPFFLKTLFQVKSSLQSLSISLDLERLVLIIWNVWKVAIGSNSRPVTQIAVENWHSTEAIFYNDSSLGNDAARAGEPCYFLSDILVWTGHESRRIISRWGTRSHEDTFWAKPQITSKRSNK